MWRRNISVQHTLKSTATANTALFGVRSVTSRGQYNPIHDFSEAISPTGRATTADQFETLVTNPSAVRVGFSADYLDWLFKGYKSKVKFLDTRATVEKKFNGALLSQSNKEELSTTEQLEAERLGLAPPPGMFVRPAHSNRRLAGEAKRRVAQQQLDQVSKQQGYMDLWERQPQFPVIHLDKASRFHVVELFKELILDRALSPTEVWDKALMFKAILQERKNSYPSSFSYIFDSVDSVVLAQEGQEQLKSRCPSQADFNYFLFLAKKYYIDNAVEGHVVLRCHREANSNDLLFSSPPPKADDEVRQAILNSSLPNSKKEEGEAAKDDQAAQAKATTVKFQAPEQYPPIEALWRCEENLPLLRVLVFGELNLMVSENPFVKFPHASAFITRPNIVNTETMNSGAGNVQQQRGDRYNQGGRGGFNRNQSAISLASLIAEKRGHLMAPIPRNTATALDSRANDIRRQLQRYHREDTVSFQNLVKNASNNATDELSASMNAYTDLTYLNPRAVRAEARDVLHRKGIEALKLYDEAEGDIYRRGLEEIEMKLGSRPTELAHTLPSYIPTVPHFLAIVEKDPHVSFLQHVSKSEAVSSRLNTLTRQLARALHNTALEFHLEKNRRINKQKVNVAAALLDNFVETTLHQFLKEATLEEIKRNEAKGASVSVSSLYQDDVVNFARRLGAPQKFQNRILDSSGFTTSARVEDYQRWMAAPEVN